MPPSHILTPFANESETIALGELTLENRLDRVSLYGNLDLTRDKVGLKQAKALKATLDRIVAALESETLPDHISVDQSPVVPNPFDGSKE